MDCSKAGSDKHQQGITCKVVNLMLPIRSVGSVMFKLLAATHWDTIAVRSNLSTVVVGVKRLVKFAILN